MSKTGNIKVLIIDNHPLFIMGLSSLLEKTANINIIGTADNYSDALEIAEKEKPTLVLMEIRLGKENGLDFIQKLKSISPTTVVLIISLLDERFYSERILRLGARGYVLKTESADTIMEAINTVLAKKVYLSGNERERILNSAAENTDKDLKEDWTGSMQKLTDRELQVFLLVAKGLGTTELSARLKLSKKTVDSHKEHIKKKLHIKTSQELRQNAIEWANHSVNL
jgi:two-component system, NarL family, response regulator NreC